MHQLSMVSQLLLIWFRVDHTFKLEVLSTVLLGVKLKYVPLTPPFMIGHGICFVALLFILPVSVFLKGHGR